MDGPIAPDDALEEYADELARSNAELANFASVAAHELRSPLQVISGFAALLKRVYGDTLDERGNEFVDAIVNGATRMENLIADLLSYAGVGATEPVNQSVELGVLVDDVVEWMAAELKEADAQVTRGALPAVTGDPVQLGQLLVNLVSNAVKFTAPEEAPRVRVSAERGDGEWRVIVADNGIGVDPAKADDIFGMFTRLHAQGRYSGTGIGLAVCRRIVESRGGAIGVEPDPGRGSRFWFTIPDGVPVPGGTDEATGDVQEALRDPLTGLANQARLATRLQRALSRAQRTGELVAVFHIDMASGGSESSADETRVEVGSRLASAIRSNDTAARILDDEFVVLCTGLRGGDDLDAVRGRLESAVAGPAPGARFGLATSTGNEAPEAVLRRARTALDQGSKR